MPPKKKQEQIDLSTLPECKSLNIFLFCKGKHERAQKILSKINTKFQKTVFHIKKSAVLDYAKQKGIYVDPQSLTDKQKKDPKFMETVCTELTPQVLAKSTDAYINNQNVKIRVEKKALLDKPQTAEQEKNKKIDCIYIFDDFPSETADFAALSSANQGIKFIFAIDPKISWASAPQEPEPVQNADQQPNQPDEQYDEQYKKMKQAQAYTQQDINNDKKIQQTLKNLRDARKKSSTNSPFRNSVIQYIKCSIDPYNEETSVQSAVNSLIPTCEQLLSSYTEFNTWLADKKSQKLPEYNENQLKAKFHKPKSESVEGENIDNTFQILTSILKSFEQGKDHKNNEDQVKDFTNFDFSGVTNLQEKQNAQIGQKKQSKAQFLQYNEQKLQIERKFLQSILQNIKYPGVDRFLMPEIPPKSEGLRKFYRSSFGQFLPSDLTFQDFERKMNILFLESAVKEVDQEKTYDFSSRIYEEQHKRQSLVRQLNRALLFDESTPVIKYNENNDKLYVCFLYKNPARRMSKKQWECNWKVLPNLENWLKYFKQNEVNSNNTHFYDIDYELIGNIQQEINAWSVKDGEVIIRKKSLAAGKQNQMLYCLPGANTGNLVFGLRSKPNSTQFYARNEIISISYSQVEKHSVQGSKKQKTVFVSFKDQTVVQFKQNGDILIRKLRQNPRLITRDGYTIIYQKNQHNTILHPNGGVSYPKSKYINPQGRGLDHHRLVQVPTLKRSTEDGQQVVTIRDDETVIVQEGARKWIKFADHTEYLLQNNQTVIEKKEYPVVKLVENGSAVFLYDGLRVELANSRNSQFQYVFTFDRICVNNNSKIVFKPNEIMIFDGKSQIPYICGLGQNPQISKHYEEQSVSVSFKNSKLKRKSNKIVDPEEEEQNFNEEDVVQPDYVQPRIFIINNDNTGTELLSEKQLGKGYFDSFNKMIGQDGVQISNDLSRAEIREVAYPNCAEKKIIHGVLPIPTRKELNRKKIKETQIVLDVYNNNQQINKESESKMKLYQVRSLIRNQPLTQSDREKVAEILRKRAEWQAKTDRQDNQFGNKPKDDPSTIDRFQSKKKVIQFRKKKEQQILTDKFKNEAIFLYQKETQSRLKQLEKINKENELKKRLSKKRSYVSQYNWKEPRPKEADQNEQFYNPESHVYTNYFETAQGKKALSLMPEWVFRPKEIKKVQQLDPQIRSQLNATMNRTKKQEDILMNNTYQKQSVNEESEHNERYDTVQPELRPSPQVYIKPSVFTQKEIDQQRFAFEYEKKAYQYHQRKRKDYNVYGRDRKDNIEVPSLMRTQPVSELNQKYLVTEAPVDKKVKISSMKNKLTSVASNMTEMRKQGPHANLIRTLDKGNDYSKLLEKRTMMVQADLNDRLQRDIQINPVEANFGLVKEGNNYELKIQIKNQDVLAQRIHLKKPKSIFCRVQMKQMGPIALGMTRKISVFLKAGPEIVGKFNDQFDIVTKHEIYHIPIQAQILSKNQFESSGTILSKTVRQFEEIGKKKRDELPPIKGSQ